jgi:hypothetical protein
LTPWRWRAAALDRLPEIGRDRLLAIDVLAGVDRLGQQRWTRLRGRGIEENAVVRLEQRLVEVDGPALDIEPPGETSTLSESRPTRIDRVS